MDYKTANVIYKRIDQTADCLMETKKAFKLFEYELSEYGIKVEGVEEIKKALSAVEENVLEMVANWETERDEFLEGDEPTK